MVLALCFAYSLGPNLRLAESALTWRGADGGLSGIDIAPDGQSFVAISDRGQLYDGTLRRDASGRLVGVEAAPPRALLDPRDQPLTDDGADAEDISIRGDRVLVSYEPPSRVWEHALDGSRTATIPYGPGFQAMRNNRGLEALATHPDGTIVVLVETFSGRVPLLVFNGREWALPATLRTRPLYAVTAADFGPDGRLYLLERAFFGIGFAARVRRMDWPGGAPETIATLPLWTVGNAEGLAVTPNGDRLRLTILTDDNRAPLLQSSEIVELTLPPEG